MSEKYVKRMNFWENLTPLDSSHLEVFLGIFWEFFIFWIQIWILNLGRFGTGPNRNRAGPVWPITGQTGPVPTGFVNPTENTHEKFSLKNGERISVGWLLCYADTPRRRRIHIRHILDTDTPWICFQTYPENADTFCVGYVYPTRLGHMGYGPNHQSAQ